ncbi:MAG: thiamine pyrophosphate-dependent enzyme, partial [Paracoccaceae bacterium]
ACATDALALLAESRSNVSPEWADWTQAARADYLAWQVPVETPGKVKMEAVVGWLSDNLPADVSVANGAGNYAAWLHRYFQYKQYGTQVAPASGSMGYGFPAAIAAKLQFPNKTVVCLAGDGCFQMTLNEMSTARQYGTAVITIVANNGLYGSIRLHQEHEYPERISGTDLANPDFVALARAYGGHGELVENTRDFPGAFERAKRSGLPAVIELRLDPEALSTGMTLSEVRTKAKTRK